MKLQFHNSYKKLFLTPSSKFDETLKVDIVLSPELYWCRVFEIPIKKVKKARKALPILFEEILPHNDFEYTCYKNSEGLFISFAYSNSEIIKAILNSGLNLSQIKNIYLAQGQMNEYEGFKIDGNYYEYLNDFLVKLPYKFNKEYPTISSEIKNNIKKYKINTQLYSELINKKYLETLFILLFMTFFLSIFKYLQYDKQILKNEKYISQIKVQNSLPQSNIRFNSIKNDLKQNYLLNENFRIKLKYLISFQDEFKNVVIKKIEFVDKKILISYENVNEKMLELYLKGKIEKFIMRTSNSLLQIEVKL